MPKNLSFSDPAFSDPAVIWPDSSTTESLPLDALLKLVPLPFNSTEDGVSPTDINKAPFNDFFDETDTDTDKTDTDKTDTDKTGGTDADVTDVSDQYDHLPVGVRGKKYTKNPY